MLLYGVCCAECCCECCVALLYCYVTCDTKGLLAVVDAFFPFGYGYSMSMLLTFFNLSPQKWRAGYISAWACIPFVLIFVDLMENLVVSFLLACYHSNCHFTKHLAAHHLLTSAHQLPCLVFELSTYTQDFKFQTRRYENTTLSRLIFHFGKRREACNVCRVCCCLYCVWYSMGEAVAQYKSKEIINTIKKYFFSF